MRIRVRKLPAQRFDVIVEPARRTRLPIVLLQKVAIEDIESQVGPIVERNVAAEQADAPARAE